MQQRAVITGIHSGIGEAIASQLKGEGWEIIGLGRGDVDLNDLTAVARVGDELREKLLTIDALIHVAGVWHSGDEVLAGKDLEDFAPEQITETMNVGLTSFMILCGKLLPIMAKRGSVIGVSGTFEHGASGWLPYYVSKRGLEDFLVGLSQDYPSGPRVYGVSPSDTATKAYERFFPKDVADAQRPEVVAQAVAHLVRGTEGSKSGEIVVIKQGKPNLGFHV